MKKLISLVLLVLVSSIVSAECTNYVGDEIALPQITTQKTYDDGMTHKMYLACIYSLTGSSTNYEIMNSQLCMAEAGTFSPTEAGNYTYTVAIYFRERQWNSNSHQWETVSEGQDNHLETTYEVCNIPDDEGFLDWIKGILCQLFGVFCNPGCPLIGGRPICP